MGWVWNDDDSKHSGADDFSVFKDFENPKSSSGGDGDGGDRCATRKVVNTRCRTEETEPGKFIRKCVKTEQIFKDCVGRMGVKAAYILPSPDHTCGIILDGCCCCCTCEYL